MSKFQYYTIESLVRFFLEQGKEGDCWDFKQEWHENIAELIKDIICFANTVHDENCYLIFGVSNDLKVTGMQKVRKKQADILDAVSNLIFAGDIYPQIEVKTIEYDGQELDVLIIANVEKTPIYLKKPYGKMNAGCIYTRVGDKNTPDNGNADIHDIENLWKKRLGLTKTPLDYIFDRLANKAEWTESEYGFYNVYHPEYTIKIIPSEEDLNAEFYAYAMCNQNTSYEELSIQYQNTILDSYQIVILDGGRLCIPIPEWGYLCHDQYGLHNKYCYKYYVGGSKSYKLLRFLYDPQNGEHCYAFVRLQEVVVFYHSEEERLAFETYIEENQTLIKDEINKATRFDYVKTETETKTKEYIKRLNTGYVLNKLLKKWRKS